MIIHFKAYIFCCFFKSFHFCLPYKLWVFNVAVCGCLLDLRLHLFWSIENSESETSRQTGKDGKDIIDEFNYYLYVDVY